MDKIPKPKHDHKTLEFPDGFLWGSGTSAHQVEGNNIYNDWWAWEQTQTEDHRSGKAADQYNLYEQDFTLAKSLSHNSHRLSIEWSRIEPKKGQYDQSAIDHYVSVLQFLKAKNMTVMLTLWHFTQPKWAADEGGWESSKMADYFNKFVEKVVPELKNYVDLWITLNEPEIYTFMAYLGGDDVGSFPPAKKNKLTSLKVTWHLARAHKKAFKTIHQLVPNAKVGIAQNISSFEASHKHSFLEMFSVIISDRITNHSFYFLTKGYHDFLGLNYYFNYRLNLKKGFIPEVVNPQDSKKNVSDLGWEIYPEGLFSILTDLSDGLPIYITEVGIASTNDDRRTRFLIEYLQEVYRAIKSGVNVKGFFYWSLIDNFEWHRGFDPRFGLVEIDYPTQTRTPRPSAYVYSEIIKHNGIPHDLLKLLGHGIKVEEVLKEKITE